jgi:8-amino-7-oxononanoate synthase
MNMLETRIREQLDKLERTGMLRELQPPSGIDLSSNDYLGYASDMRLKLAMAKAIWTEGCGSTGSRLLRGERSRFSALERQFAEFKGTEAALYFSSGYLANLAVLSTFLDEGDVLFFDRLNHASLIDGMKLGRARKIIFPHANSEALRRLVTSIETSGQRFLVTESLFSMDGDPAPLREYADLCREAGIALIVDEAHAVGIYGTSGTGLIEASGIANDVFLSINSAGKALGVSGAFVAGPAWAIDYLIQRARTFIFSTAAPPPVADALRVAINLIAEEPDRRRKLLANACLLRELLRCRGLDIPLAESPIMPVILGENRRAVVVAEELQSRGFDVRAIRPPTVPDGTARLRISIKANLNEVTLYEFVQTLADSLERHQK